MEKLFKLHQRMVELHIGTKANDLVFHEASASFYELFFKILHLILEKRQDIEIDSPIDCKMARNEAYDLMEEMKKELAVMIKEDNTYGMDNLLRGLFDSLETECGTARGLAGEEEEEEEEEIPEDIEETD